MNSLKDLLDYINICRSWQTVSTKYVDDPDDFYILRIFQMTNMNKKLILMLTWAS